MVRILAEDGEGRPMTIDQKVDRIVALLEALVSRNDAAAHDLLNVDEYTEWARNGSVQTTYNQISKGSCLVEPFSLKPRPLWRRADLEAALARRDLVAAQRKSRFKKRYASRS